MAAVLGAACSAPESSPRGRFAGTDVVVYLIDTLRPDHLGAYGYDRPTSPRIDELARDGTVFERAYSQSSWTRPAVASLLTGLYPPGHGVEGLRSALSDDATTLAERLSKLGYETAAFVSNLHLEPRFGLDQGLDRFEEVGSLHGHSSHELARVAGRWLRDRSPERPFFLYVHASDTHAPYAPPPARLRELGLRVADPGLSTGDGRAAVADAAGLPPDERDRVRRDLIALYDGEVAHADAGFGMLVDELRRLELYDDTLLVLLADHGEEFYEHGALGHGDTLYVEQLRIPLIVKFPRGWNAGRRSDRIVELVDVAPTILRAVGDGERTDGESRAADRFQGRGLLGPPGGGTGDGPAVSLATLAIEGKGRRIESLLEGRFHLIRSRPLAAEDEADRRPSSPVRLELYDLTADPRERHDLSEAEADRARLLERLLDEILAGIERGVRPDEVELDDDLTERLRALGYLR